MIEVMIKVAAGAVTAAVCATVVRRGTPELGFLLALAARNLGAVDGGGQPEAGDGLDEMAV